MIVIPERHACFIHIPRTGGMALQTAIQRTFPLAQRHTRGWEHVAAHAVRRMLPSSDYRVFIVIRNPWSIFTSHWGWLQRVKTIPDFDVSEDIAHGIAIEGAMSFVESVQLCVGEDILATDGGFAARYCDTETIVFRYECDPWPTIAALLDCELQMERENESLCEPPRWDQASIELVGRYCRGDVERFGYVAPGDRGGGRVAELLAADEDDIVRRIGNSIRAGRVDPILRWAQQFVGVLISPRIRRDVLPCVRSLPLALVWKIGRRDMQRRETLLSTWIDTQIQLENVDLCLKRTELGSCRPNL